MAHSKISIDIHCHPALKPFGQSWPLKLNSADKSRKNSIWYFNPPTLLNKLLEYIAGFTKFSQSDFTALAKGNIFVVFVSLYSPEKGFFKNKLGNGKVPTALEDCITGFGEQRIKYIEQNNNYFSDLVEEHNFYRQLDGYKIKIWKKKYRYQLAKNFNEIQQAISQPELDSIMVVHTIEGGHVFNCGFDPKYNPANHNDVLNNIGIVKQWEYPVFFIALAHHFYNELCGHSKSLPEVLCKLTDHEYGLDGGITALGKKVIKKLLDKTSGRRIYIDIKHMSALSRKEYFEILRTEYAGEDIPIIVSHGSVNGLKSFEERINGEFNDENKFLQEEINFFDTEIIEIEKSGGIFGIQMDEKRIASKEEIKKTKGRIIRSKILYHQSKLIWNQIEYIAKVLDKAGRFSWGVATLGSDNDGLVNPLSGYWTSKEISYLHTYLLDHAREYFAGGAQKLIQSQNKNITVEQIVQRVLFQNAYNFLEKYY